MPTVADLEVLESSKPMGILLELRIGSWQAKQKQHHSKRKSKRRTSYLQVRRKKEDTMNKEDYLMRQIDEFRDKAKQLQLLLKAKETQVNELETMVNAREAKAVELEGLLQVRKSEADQLVTETSAQIQLMIQALDRQMEQFNTSLGDQVQGVNEQFGERVQSLEEKLDAIKADICDKVHTEDVKCYRNMKSLIEGQNEKFDNVKLSDESLKSVRKSFKGLKFLAFFAFVDFILLILFALYELGVFDMLLLF